MKHFIKQEIPAKTIEIQEKISCDLCGKETYDYDWRKGPYRIDEIIVRRKEGTNFPEGGGGTVYEIDICPECFMNKFIPWIESQGCIINVTEWDN